MHFYAVIQPGDIKRITSAFLDYLGMGHVRVVVAILVRRLTPFPATRKFENGVLVIETLKLTAQLTCAYNHACSPLEDPMNCDNRP